MHNHQIIKQPCHLSSNAVHQCFVSLNQTGVLLSDELDGTDDLASGWEIKLLDWVAEDGGEDWNELWGETEDRGVLVLVCN